MVARAGEGEGAAAEHRRMLAESVAGFVARGGGIARVRRLREDPAEHDPKAWSAMAELGWLGILVPERYGGLGLGLTEMAIVARGLARGLAPEPLAACAVLATRALAHAGSEEWKARELPRLAAGEALAALAWQEDAGVLDASGPRLAAVSFEGGYRLTGVKRYVAGAAQAGVFLVSARLNGEFALFGVPRATAGAKLALDSLADGRASGTLELDEALVPRGNLVARGAAAAAGTERALDEARVIAAAELCGVMGRALEMSLDYLRTRVQFGKPIGSFQALQHRAVDLHIHHEIAAAVLAETLAELDGEADDARRAAAASRAKARCADAAAKITRETIQLHGAIGFTDEFDAGLYLKRALTLAAWLGGATAHRRRYARLTGVGRES
ncbi:MAG: acyl-CoA/acyl-ACP dehydrogenase [Burkholderiales bacterium]|nr:acyl-CoA/acyl-ACP dehydrogenase [Burkholderiales bacterium]